MMLFVLLSLHVYAADVLINEVLYDAAQGQDEGAGEWIELCNPTRDTIDISGWQVQAAGKSWTTVWLIADLQLLPGEHRLLGPGAEDFSPNLQNGGNATDGVRLINVEGEVVDTLLYDAPNINDLYDDRGHASGPFAPDVSAGDSLGRRWDCEERFDSGEDFVPFSPADQTPGAPNPAPRLCTPPTAGQVVLNELMVNPPGADSGGEWVELYNAGATPIDLSGWRLAGGTTAGGFLTDPFPDDTWVDSGEHWVVLPDSALGNAAQNADGVSLIDCDGQTQDTVIYGERLDLEDGWQDDQGREPSLAPRPREGESIGRLPDGVDTDEIEQDIVALPYPSPGAPNDHVRTCPGQSDLKINELFPNPDSTDTHREWIELYNRGADPISLEGWALEWGTSGYSGALSLPTEAAVPPGGLFLIGGAQVPDVDMEATLSMGGASSSPDSVRLLHCGPGIADTVVYGPQSASNTDGWTDDRGDIAQSWAPQPPSGQSLARRQDGEDSDDASIDFALSPTPTPGTANPIRRCIAGQRTIKINEVFPDPEGSDSGAEWIELYNVGDQPMALDGWWIEAGASDWAVRYTLPPQTDIAPGEHLLLADTDSLGDLQMGNAASGLDGVRLIDCPGEIEDTLLYAEANATLDPTEIDWRDDQDAQRFATFPTRSGYSLGRLPDGADADDCATDFVTLEPTPGAPNPTQQRNAATPLTRGCQVVSAGGIGWLWALGLIAWRRGRADR